MAVTPWMGTSLLIGDSGITSPVYPSKYLNFNFKLLPSLIKINWTTSGIMQLLFSGDNLFLSLSWEIKKV